jgi:hypothetical protein
MGTAAPIRRPLPLIAVLGPVIAAICALLVFLAAPAADMGLWDAGTAASLARWGAYGAIPAILLSLLGAAVTRPGTGRRGFALGIIGVVLGLAAVLFGWAR